MEKNLKNQIQQSAQPETPEKTAGEQLLENGILFLLAFFGIVVAIRFVRWMWRTLCESFTD